MASHDDLLEEFARRYPPLIRYDEAAQIARKKLKTIYAWSSAGQFDGFKSANGRQRLLIRDEFLKFLLVENEQES